MAITIDQLAQQIFDECQKDGEPVTRLEAYEMAKMELKAKEVKNYVTTEKANKPKQREPKQDPTKILLINLLTKFLEGLQVTENIQITNPQQKITFLSNGENFTITLTKHRKKG